ncbi:uncharacterized protein LOC115245314 [Formica exsecta]|uniref:uncharacterized protein LOC115245314 n=1 Tax=Formica exsecta TaxID=72781 RepID=UPI0011442B87|nr:uncharacterized protein LOC115245314 [Formica exsecta]
MGTKLNNGQLSSYNQSNMKNSDCRIVKSRKVRLARSYIQDKMQRDAQEEFQLDSLFDEQGFIRVRVFSRFRNATKHQIFIAYNIRDADNIDDEREAIFGYYCTCKSGARTVGTCAHVTSVL